MSARPVGSFQASDWGGVVAEMSLRLSRGDPAFRCFEFYSNSDLIELTAFAGEFTILLQQLK
jgi:hypothetical protein